MTGNAALMGCGEGKDGGESVFATRGSDGGLLVEGTARYSIPEMAVRRSELLKTLSALLDGREAVRIPIEERDFRHWYAVAIGSANDDCNTSSESTNLLNQILQAIDSLGDPDTLRRVCDVQAPRVRAALRDLADPPGPASAGVSSEPSQQASGADASTPASTPAKAVADQGDDTGPCEPMDLLHVLTALPPDLAVMLLQPAVAPAGAKPVVSPAPPITFPPGVCALPLSLSDVALRACAPDIDANHSLNISLRTPACMELLTSALPGIPALDSLHITVTFGVRDESPYQRMLRAVCAMPRLFVLQLTDTTVMDHHILSLAAEVHGGMPLEVLRMEVAQETAEAGVAFTVALAVMPRLRSLSFMEGSLWAGGFTRLHEWGLQLRCLQELHTDRLDLKKAYVVAFADGVIPNCHTLEAGTNDVYGGGSHMTLPLQYAVDVCRSLPHLRDIAIRDLDISPPKIAAALTLEPTVLQNLTRLDFSFSFARSESADVGRLLSQMPLLASLTLRAPPGDEDRSLLVNEFAADLATLTSLSHLDLSGTQLTVDCAHALAEALIALTALLCVGLSEVVSGNAFGPDRGAAAVEAAVARGLAASDSVRELRLEQSFLPPESLGTLLSGMPQLRDLRLSGTVLGEEGARSLTRGLMHAAGLQALRLSQACLDPLAMRALAPALAALGSLTLLDLSYNQMGREGAVELAEGLCPQGPSRKRKGAAALPRLVVLDLAFSQLGQEGLAALQSGLQGLPSLRELNLRQAESVPHQMVEALRSAKQDLYVLI